jgi:hypothetical protein
MKAACTVYLMFGNADFAAVGPYLAQQTVTPNVLFIPSGTFVPLQSRDGGLLVQIMCSVNVLIVVVGGFPSVVALTGLHLFAYANVPLSPHHLKDHERFDLADGSDWAWRRGGGALLHGVVCVVRGLFRVADRLFRNQRPSRRLPSHAA